MQYEQAFALLQTGKSPEEALERLNKALEYDPTFGDAYVLKSYVRLEVLPNLDEALAAGKSGRAVCPEESGFALYAWIDLRKTRAVCRSRTGAAGGASGQSRTMSTCISRWASSTPTT